MLEQLDTLGFGMKRITLDMLNIKTWIDSSNGEISGTIHIEESVDVTKIILMICSGLYPLLRDYNWYRFKGQVTIRLSNFYTNNRENISRN